MKTTKQPLYSTRCPSWIWPCILMSSVVHRLAFLKPIPVAVVSLDRKHSFDRYFTRENETRLGAEESYLK